MSSRLKRLVSKLRRDRPAGADPDRIHELIAELQDHAQAADTWLRLGRALARKGEWCWAFLAATEASRIDERSSQSVWLSADCLARSGLSVEGVALLEERGLIDHQDADSLYAAARLGIRGRDPRVALPLIEAVLNCAPLHEGALDGKLQMLRVDGRHQEAEEFILQLQALESPESFRVLARDRIADRDPTRAIEFLSRTPARDPETQILKSRVLLTMGFFSEARSEALAALRERPDDRTARKWLEEAERQRHITEMIPVPVGRPPSPISVVAGRVLHLVSTSLPYVQAGYTIRSQAVGLVQAACGLDPHFVTPPGFPETDRVSLDRIDGVPYHRLRPGPSPYHVDEKQQQFASQASDLVETLRPSVLHAHSDFLNCSVALGVGKRHSLPVVYEVRGFLEETWIANNPWASRDSDRYVWRREAETRCMEGAAAVVTLGDVMRREIVSRGIPPEKITVIPNAVDPSRFKSGQRDRSTLAKLGVSVDETVIGYVSSLRRNEGVDYLLKALRVLLDEGHRVRGLIVGSGPELPFLRQVAADLGIGDRVVFTGAVPHELVDSYYGLIDIFVVPRTKEIVNQLVTPLKPYEAMAAGTVVVVSSIPALREMVVEGETGLTFMPEDSEDLARVLQSVLADRDRWDQLARRGRAWVIEHRSWSVNGEAYRALYKRIV